MADLCNAEAGSQVPETPAGILMLRTMSMPADANPNGDVFGGWIMSQMDAGGAMMAYEMCQGKVVTVAADEIVFRNPVTVGDVVCVYARCVHIGNTSLKVRLQFWTKRGISARSTRVKVAESCFTYVAVDDAGKKRPLPLSLTEHREEILRLGYSADLL